MTTTKKSTVIVFDLFFHKIQWLPNFFWKTLNPFFSKNIGICIRHYWLNRYFLWCSLTGSNICTTFKDTLYTGCFLKNATSHICYLWLDLNKTKTGINHFKNRSDDSQLCFSNSLVYFLIPILKEIIFLNPRMCLMLECI
jgi:hypothetical protein